MKPKHTKGNWLPINIELKDWSSSTVSVEKGKTVCIMYYDGNEISDEVKANAKLIAAAPEMLSESIEVKYYAEQCLLSLDRGSIAEVRGLLEEVIKKMNSVIDSATTI